MSDRREFIKRGLGALSWGLLARGGLGAGNQASGRERFEGFARSGDSNPYGVVPTNPNSVLIGGYPFEPWFTGDDFQDPQTIPFHVGFTGTFPAPTEDVDVAVVGGGISGLGTAYLLRRHRPVVFDLRPRFGGNALGERWHGTRFSMGSAYVIAPDEGSFLERLYRRLDLDLIKEVSLPPDPVELQGQIHAGFWSGTGFSPAEQQAFTAYARAVAFMAENYPDIPLSEDPVAAALVRDLDQSTFCQDLEARMGMPLTPLLAAGIQSYFYSAFGAGMQEVSAASGWNFVAAEEYGRWVFPGGNAAMAKAFWSKIRDVEQFQPTAPPLLRAGCRVVDVRLDDDRVNVGYIDAQGVPRSLRAKTVVMAGGKQICKYVLHDLAKLDPEKYEAMHRIETAAYVVVNVLLDVPAATNEYDIFRVGDASFPMTPLAFEPNSRPIDVLNGNFASNPQLQRSVLTLYWPLPYPSARFSLILNDPYTHYAQTLIPHLESTLDLLGVPHSAVRQIRMTRWGHAMPIARPRFIYDGVPQELLRPFGERVFFVNQDNWALPAVENSLLDARSVALQIHDLLA